ncbi:MAG: hypothetical protein LQ343_006547 [Gyalolechia ehrenbergii]|nr:MAG: hypothetical protein LQ343_006547 [Gyalolechia ehrenbergii]
MSRHNKQSPVAAQVKFNSLKNCLVNLPQSLVNVVISTGTPVQNVIVEILLEDKDKDGKTFLRSIYAGWTGVHSVQKSTLNRNEYDFSGKEIGRETIEVDPTFGRTLGLTESQKIGLLLHLQPPLAHTVHVEPLTLEDWEVIELHANFLELNLLSQIRALPNPSFSASPSVPAQHTHPLTLHLSPTSTASIIVTALVPSPASSVPFAKLAPDAEVVVAPKARPWWSERKVSRTIVSTGHKSAGGRSKRSSGHRRTLSNQDQAQKTLLLRPCDRKFCDKSFNSETDGSHDNVGLRLWVDPMAMEGSDWGGITHVSVSVVNPAGLILEPQQREEPELRDNEKASLVVVATLLPYYSAPSSTHAVLSSQLCSSLKISGIAGGIVEVKAAPLPISKSAIQSLLVLPFLPGSGQQDDFIRLGDRLRAGRHKILEDFVNQFSDRESTKDFFQGPLTEGLVVPPVKAVDQGLPWPGGILRFAWRPRSKGESELPSLAWVNGLGMETALEIGSEVANPLQVRSSSDDGLPEQVASLIGNEKLSDLLLSNLSHSSSVFLTGGLGSGKSSLVQSVGCQLRSKLQYHVSYLPCRKLTVDEVRVSTVKDSIEQLFTAASWAIRLGGQAIAILDDLDKLCPIVTELQTQDNSRSNQISELLCNITRRYCAKTSGVTLLATAQSQDSLNTLLVGANVFKDIVNLQAPDKDRRRRLLQAMVGDPGIQAGAINDMSGHALDESAVDQAGAGWMDDSLPPSPAITSTDSVVMDRRLDLLEIAGQTDGYMPADLALLVSRAKSEALIESVAKGYESSSDSDVFLRNQDFDRALKGFTPASLRNVTLQSSNMTFDAIGGLKATRKILLETLQYPTLYAPIFAHCPLRLRSGLLLYGYPGCGKTLLASAVAGECGLNFISVKGPEILNKYIGASEKSVRDLFERAESARPCVLFFDEFDSIAPKRGHDSTGVTDRVVNQLLTQMDGAEGLNGVYVLAATSRPDLIDPALLRPGRLDKSILCDLPDFDDRLDIVTVISKKLQMDPKVLSSRRQSLYEVARRTEGYTGADLQAVVYNAHLEAIHDELGDNKSGGKVGKKGQEAKHGRFLTEPDILQFRFGEDVDAQRKSTGINHARETAEYRAVVAKLDDLRRTRRIERRRRRESVTDRSEDAGPADERGERGVQDIIIQWKHIEASLSSTRSSISPRERERLTRFYREFTIGRTGELPTGEGSTEVGGRSSLM